MRDMNETDNNQQQDGNGRFCQQNGLEASFEPPLLPSTEVVPAEEPLEPLSPWRGKTPLAPLNPEHFNPWLAVLENANIWHWVDRTGAFPVILVCEEDVFQARAELDAYEEVNCNWPKRPVVNEEHVPLMSDNAIFANMVFFACLFRFYAFVENTWEMTAWKTRGLWDVWAVRDGEWWRNVTALTLHADVAHVLSNMFWGFAFGSLVGTQIGVGFGLLLMVTSGALGNFTMMFLLDSDISHQSLGASTMVFGLLGVLSAVQTYEAWQHREEGRSRVVRLLPWIPLLGGIGMTAIYGGAAGTDTLAHACGFGCGCLLGIAMPWCRSMLNTLSWQIAAGSTALMVLVLGWLAAWN